MNFQWIFYSYDFGLVHFMIISYCRPPATFLKKKKRKRHDSSESDPELKHAVTETEEIEDDSIQVSISTIVLCACGGLQALIVLKINQIKIITCNNFLCWK
jgi:hypothetical protein